MERPQLLGTDDAGNVERCRECRGRLVQSGEEVTCTNCGVIARSERTPQVMATATRQRRNGDEHLGSYIGTKKDENSHAPFNGNSTVGYAKRVSDHMGEDGAAWNCSAMIERVAEKLSLPAFVRENAVVLSRKMLADRKSGEPKQRNRATVPAISAYALLAACRDARIDRVSAKSIMQAHTDLGHKVTKSKLLRLGMESQVPIRPADPATLLQTVVSRLESNEVVAGRLEKNGVERPQYFRQLLQASQTIVGEVRARMPGSSPRTVAASSVYMAAREIGPRAVTQKEAAETMGVAEYTIREFSGWATRELHRPLKAGGA